ncbi:uncharacterized protein [Anabrus simplex]|uniref:uncharacterized protein n=1 Tax=Anabrus simplex TaxID=316456 RepID=UPI0035A37186
MIKQLPVLLSKSQTPSTKTAKLQAVEQLRESCEKNLGRQFTADQVKKGIHNMKTEVKKKSDRNTTGNRKIQLKKWEEELLNLMEGQQNPSFTRVPGGCAVGGSKEHAADIKDDSISLQSTSPPRKYKKIKLAAETEETERLSNMELQRLVLLEQLKLARMQQQEVEERKLVSKLNLSEQTYIQFE